MSTSHGAVLALPMSPSYGVASRQPFRPNRIEATPMEVTPTGDAGIPFMRYGPGGAQGRNEDNSLEKEVKLHFAEVLNDIKHLSMQEEAQSGEEDINVEDDSIKKDAAPRSFTGAAAKRLEEETVVR